MKKAVSEPPMRFACPSFWGQQMILLTFLLGPLSSFAILGGVFSTDPLPSYLSEEDRTKIQSHTVVLLNSQNSSHERCSGTLIGPNTVLTAAHCIPKDLRNFDVVPSIYEFAISERRPAIRARIHEGYKTFDIPTILSPNFDIALVQFDGKLPDRYQPTTWIESFEPISDRFWFYVAGYGISGNSKGDSGELRFSRVIIESALANSKTSFMTGNQSSGEGICKGDSGGPAFIKIKNAFYVIGVVSGTVGSCTGTSYFNQTTFYRDWIQKALSEINSPKND